MARITGYGRGWQEPLATGRWARFRQWLREPATKTSWAWALAAFVFALPILMVVVGLVRLGE